MYLSPRTYDLTDLAVITRHITRLHRRVLVIQATIIMGSVATFLRVGRGVGVANHRSFFFQWGGVLIASFAAFGVTHGLRVRIRELMDQAARIIRSNPRL